MIATNDGTIGTDGRFWFGDFSGSIGLSFGPSQFSNTGLIESLGNSDVQIDLVYDPIKGAISFTNYGEIEAVGQGAVVDISAYDVNDTSKNDGTNAEPLTQ